MAIRFTKMHGLGNHFMVIDGVNQSIDLSKKQITQLAQSDIGVGFDQCLIIEPSRSHNVDFFYRIFNADGQEVGQCGNGARCVARFVNHYGLTKKKIISVATMTTCMQLVINTDDTVTVDMGIPRLNPKEIPFLAKAYSPSYELTLLDNSLHRVHALSVGNPHAITIVDDLARTDVMRLGQEISEHRCFPEQVNAGFMQLINNRHILLRVYERGSQETKACGSGAIAAAAVGRLYYQCEPEVTITLPGGDLMVSWPKIDGPIYLTGPATFVYEGVLFPSTY